MDAYLFIWPMLVGLNYQETAAKLQLERRRCPISTKGSNKSGNNGCREGTLLAKLLIGKLGAHSIEELVALRASRGLPRSSGIRSMEVVIRCNMDQAPRS